MENRVRSNPRLAERTESVNPGSVTLKRQTTKITTKDLKDIEVERAEFVLSQSVGFRGNLR
jgi:hypothetical protein